MSVKMQQPPQMADERTLSTRSAVGTVFGLEMRQRLRGRAWYIMLAVWFVVIAAVFLLALATMGSYMDIGPMLFDLVVGFVLFFGLLVAPGLSANAVNGDRAAGTLAVLQVTLLTPGQLLAGKWLASWVGSLAFLVLSAPFIFWALALGGVPASEAFISLGMLALELGLVCAIGVGVSAIANRPLFSIVATYMLVALLSLGTLITFGLSTALVMEEAEVTTSYYSYPMPAENLDDQSPEPQPGDPECTTETFVQPVAHTERITWMLAANPFVVVADAVPYSRSAADAGQSGDFGYVENYRPPGVMEGISQQVRNFQAGPDYNVTCAESQGLARDVDDKFPIWPLGLLLQSLLAGGLLLLGYRRLRTPVRRLAQGTRIA
ncbi:ABC transporter permease subunit [Arthrobacter sp. MSA 4-2]|uniref:ABC transporter permease n=1 Tax=Arthrobacter sp. MSA 4-2 TaxID=2794349 RepID=UPI0018E87A4E|nr:ABC transporter permease subunit [Arthrobacter sp. MSA 4-2]MBJ2120801.1 ABC transporter permease subunit [Arthrobacter sp. MSA 4-2]